MAASSRLQTNALPSITEGNATPVSPPIPSRGRETRTALLQKLRPPPLVHAWDCWIEKPPTITMTTNILSASPYKPDLTHLQTITDIRMFWAVLNNLPLTLIAPRSSFHLFKKTVLPIWEHRRNVRGGSWTFRLPYMSPNSADFFTELCLLAVGEQLQAALETEEKGRTRFKDDVCGVSWNVRGKDLVSVQVWNRDGENEGGVKRLLQCVLEKVGECCRPKEGAWCYQKHKEQKGFVADQVGGHGGGSENARVCSRGSADVPAMEIGKSSETSFSEGASSHLAKMEEDIRKVRRILAEVKASDEAMVRRTLERPTSTS